MCATSGSRLAFRNDVSGNIAFIDYSNGTLSVVEIIDSIDAYHPDISPDGSHVAFSTMYEGLDGKSAVYVRDLNEEGSNLIKLDVESAAIPRWRVLESGDTAIVYVTSAGNNKDEAAFRSTRCNDLLQKSLILIQKANFCIIKHWFSKKSSVYYRYKDTSHLIKFFFEKMKNRRS